MSRGSVARRRPPTALPAGSDGCHRGARSRGAHPGRLTDNGPRERALPASARMTASGDLPGRDEAPDGDREQELDELVATLNERRATIDRLNAERDAARREAAAIRARMVVRVAVGAANRVRKARATVRSL